MDGITGRGIGADGVGALGAGVGAGVNGKEPDLFADGNVAEICGFSNTGAGAVGTTGLVGNGVLSIFLGTLTPWGCWPALSLDKSSLMVRIEDWYSLA